MRQVPTVISTGLICFGLGAAVGVAAMATFGASWMPQPKAEAPGVQLAANGSQGRGQSGGGPPFLGGLGAANPKEQLATLVVKLDLLTHKPLAIRLTDEQRTKLREQLQGLSDKEQLDPAEALKRLEEIQKIVESDKGTLEAAGFSWPVPRSAGRPTDVPNPFKQEQNGQHLKSLQEEVTKTKPG
jgi:hypothetical protein